MYTDIIYGILFTIVIAIIIVQLCECVNTLRNGAEIIKNIDNATYEPYIASKLDMQECLDKVYRENKNLQHDTKLWLMGQIHRINQL